MARPLRPRRRARAGTLPCKVLLLNGDLDLDTFPEWGAHAAATLPRAVNLVVPYATHSTMSIPCVQKIMSAFLLADGDAARVDRACLAELRAPSWAR
jgi:hypothetical protein